MGFESHARRSVSDAATGRLKPISDHLGVIILGISERRNLNQRLKRSHLGPRFMANTLEQNIKVLRIRDHISHSLRALRAQSLCDYG